MGNKGTEKMGKKDTQDTHTRAHSKAQDFACLKNCNKHFAKFLGSVRVGTTRKTWSQTLVTSRALLQILKNCFFTMKMAGLLSFIIILVTEFGCL